MSQEPQKFPKRGRGEVEVVYRAGAGPPKRVEIKVTKEAKAEQDDAGPLQKPGQRSQQVDDGGVFRAYFFLAVGLTILLVVGLVWKIADHPRVEVAMARTPESAGPTTPIAPVLTGLMSDRSPEEIVEAVVFAVQGFMNAETEEERSTWVVDGEVMSEKMTEYYGREERAAPKGFGEVWISRAISIKGIPAEIVLVEAREGGKKWWLNVLPTKDRMLIEWESSMAYGEMSWNQFLTEKPLEAVQMRVVLTMEGYYNFDFSDDVKYQCLRIRSVGSEETIFGYVVRDSKSADVLSNAKTRQSSIPANIRIKYLPWSRDKNMVLIEEVTHLNWINNERLIERLLAQPTSD